MEQRAEDKIIINDLLKLSQRLIRIIFLMTGGFISFILLLIYKPDIKFWFKKSKEEIESEKINKETLVNFEIEKKLKEEAATFWTPSDVKVIQDSELKKQVDYGKELIAHTAKYLGPNGTVMQITNGMNCQNCHLDAGTKAWGNNYGGVFSTYPKYRARSGKEEDIYKRVNDCIERSLNGKALENNSKEMQAIKAYIEYIGKDVTKGEKPKASGIYELAYLDRALDTARGKKIYTQKCQSCHQANGQGLLAADKIEYTYPPLWGQQSYNVGAGLYRMSRFAGYVKYNMPQGATYIKPQLTDEEAWDVAAYVNSQPRPTKDLSGDWPKIAEKPVDHPFGLYADSFNENQHKYGPFQPIADSKKKYKK